MEGRSAPLPPRRRWEGHWWWPGRPSAAARGARAAVAACAATASSGAAWLRAGLAGAARRLSYSSFYFAKFEPIEETQAGRLEALRDGRFSPSGRPDLRIALPKKRGKRPPLAMGDNDGDQVFRVPSRRRRRNGERMVRDLSEREHTSRRTATASRARRRRSSSSRRASRSTTHRTAP